VVGGAAVLGSYYFGWVSDPERAGDLWGGISGGSQALYSVFILFATLGYFAFTMWFVTRLERGSRILIGGRGWGLIHALYAVMLFASALWMPLTVAMLRDPSEGLWLVIRLVLAVVGLASIGLLIVLLTADADKSGWLYAAAVAGLLAFCFQTAVLDALVWPAYFR
jgi:hypothetical protein